MNQPVVGTSIQLEDRSTDLRAKIVGILSDTANGCISELGYFPSLLRKLRELEQANNKWKEENVRLFQDNRALAQYTRHQEEQIKTVATATPDSANKIAMLEEQVKTLSMQNIELRKMNEALASSTNCNNPAHQRLLADNQKIASMHHTALRTIHHLQHGVQPNAFHDNGKLPKQNIALPSQDPRQQRVPHGYPPSHSLSMTMGAQQQTGGSTVFHQNASQPRTSPMPNLRMDYESVSTALQMDAVIPNISRSVPPQTSPISPMNSAPLPTTRRKDSTQTKPSIVPNTQPYRRTSLTIQTRDSPVRHGASNSPQNPPLDNDQCSYDGTRWGGLLPSSPHSNRMAPSQSVPIPTSKSLLPQQVTNQALSPVAHDFYIQRTSPTNSVPLELLSPSDSASIQTPICNNQETLPVEVVSSPWMAFDQMKRERDDIGSDSLDTESAKKKIRLGEEDRAMEAVQVQDTNMDDESEEIEIDSDGLRSISSCISELMENSMENPECYMCRLCDIRYKTGVISAPKPLVGVTQEQLVQHLTTEHTDAWEALRHDV